MADSITIGGHSYPKKEVYLAAGGVVLIGGVVYIEKRKNAAATAAVSTSSAATDASNLDAAGYEIGSPEDLAWQQAQTGAATGYDYPGSDNASAVDGSGQVIGYDAYGNPIYGTSTTSGDSPGSYTSNAEWAQAYEQQVGSTGNDAVAAALGKYLTGGQCTTDQQQTIQEAIASQGYPPIGGPGGYPPSIKTVPNPTGTTTTKVKVPNCVGKTVNQAQTALTSAGLVFNGASTPDKAGFSRIVHSQSPKAGASAAPGSKVSLSWTFVKNK